MSAVCRHLDQIRPDAAPSVDGCSDCLAAGGRWVHLRMCRTCGHVGCCDDSPRRHARAHAAGASHPVVSSFEPGEDWWWCFADEVAFTVPGVPVLSHS